MRMMLDATETKLLVAGLKLIKMQAKRHGSPVQYAAAQELINRMESLQSDQALRLGLVAAIRRLDLFGETAHRMTKREKVARLTEWMGS
jgi:hypothetical protein